MSRLWRAARAYLGRYRQPAGQHRPGRVVPVWASWRIPTTWLDRATAHGTTSAPGADPHPAADTVAAIAAPGWPALLTPPTGGERGPATQRTATGLAFWSADCTSAFTSGAGVNHAVGAPRTAAGDDMAPADGEEGASTPYASPAGVPDPVASWVGPPVTPLAPHPSDPWRVDWWDADTDATHIIGNILAAAPRHAADRLVPMADPALAGRTEA